MPKSPFARAALRSSARIASSSRHPATRAPTPILHHHQQHQFAKMTTSGSAGAPPEEYKQQNQEKRPTSNFFPLGYKDALYQWWTSVTPPIAERNVLSFMPHLKEAVDTLKDPSADDKDYPPGTRVWRRELVQLPGKNRALNEVSIERVGEEAEDTLVMVHGYGAGLGFFYKNFEALSRQPGMKLYALDMLGMGNSTRPPFKIHAKTKEEQVIEAENFFIDALEEWRQSRKIERFTLLGHSLGGYLAVSYALKYPGHLKKLILASPVGVPKDPYAVNASMPDPDDQSVAEEFIQEEEAVSPPPKDGTQTKNASGANTPKRPLPSWAVWLWDANVSPFSLIRMAGPLGPRFISGWTSRRFKHLPTPEAEALHDYTFSIFKQKGSGEYALSYILAPGAYARRPVIDRIQHVGRQKLPNSDKKETGFPIVFMYGEQDWMDVAGGLAAEEKLKQTQAKILANATEEEKKAENGSVRVVMIPKAGHHLYLENPDYFNEVMMKELASTRQDDEKRRSHQ